MVEKITRWYDKGWWDEESVRLAVGSLITAEEYKNITGLDYKE